MIFVFLTVAALLGFIPAAVALWVAAALAAVAVAVTVS